MFEMRNLTIKKDATSHRASSWDRSGGNNDAFKIEPGEAKVIADVEGPGYINHIWMTVGGGEDYYLRKLLIRIYWDGEAEPSIESPLGDFFGVGHGVANHFVSIPLNMITTQGAPQTVTAMNCFFSMPFLKARVEIVNECKTSVGAFYFYIDYEKVDQLPENTLRFHAQWRRENPTDGVISIEKSGSKEKYLEDYKNFLDIKNLTGEENYIILDAEGPGHYVGCNLSIDHINPVPGFSWFGEGDDMIFIDGEKWPPSLHGTGTEDYFCCAYGYPAMKHDALYHGISLAEPITDKGTWPRGTEENHLIWSGKYTQYRFHLTDPIHFKESIKVTIEHGHGNCHSNDYSSVAYWYQAEPHKTFEKILDADKRLPLPTAESMRRYYRSI